MGVSVERAMQEALDLARSAGANGEVPVGAVVMDPGGDVIGRGMNAPIGRNDPSAHAEVLALRDAAARMGNYRLPGCTLVATIEPGTMCAGAMVHARIERLVFAAREPKAGAVVSTASVLSNAALNHQIDVEEGLMADEAAALLRTFFKQRREQRVD